MRGVLREKVKKKTTAAQIIAKVLLATNMSSKSHKFNLQYVYAKSVHTQTSLQVTIQSI